MAIAYDIPRRPLPKPRRKIPESLIYEIMDGKPIYRKGYRDIVIMDGHLFNIRAI